MPSVSEKGISSEMCLSPIAETITNASDAAITNVTANSLRRRLSLRFSIRSRMPKKIGISIERYG